MNNMKQGWDLDCHEGIEKVIEKFREELPNWWYSLGECQVSCDASCAPTSLSPDIGLIPQDERFNSGFHADVPQPSKLSHALLIVMHEALAAKARCAGNIAEADKYEEVATLVRIAKGCEHEPLEEEPGNLGALKEDESVLEEKGDLR